MTMNNIRFEDSNIACISDIHIGVHQSSGLWHGITMDFVTWFKQELIKRDIRDIVICGDVNNDRNEISVSTMCVINKFFNELKDFNIIILVGNHDAYYRDRSDINSLSLLGGWDNITIIDEVTTIEQFDKTYTFVPWAVPIEDVPKSDIIFGHFDITGFKMSRSKICADGINSYEIIDKGNLVVSGHFHLRDERKYTDGTILYLGSPYELSWRECGDTKGFYGLDLKTNKFDFVENTISPKHKKIRLSELLAAGKITQDLKDEFPGNFISFIIDTEVNTDKIDNLVTKLSALKPLSIKSDFEIENKYSVDDANYEFTGVDIPQAIEEFVNLLDIEKKKDVLNITLELLKQAE